MNSKERTLKSLSHKEPDMVPIDLGTTSCTGINVSSYIKLLEYFGIREKVELFDKYQQSANVSIKIREIMGIDTITPFFFKKLESHKVENDERVIIDEWGVVRKKPRGGFYYDIISSPLKNKELNEIKEMDLSKVLHNIKLDYYNLDKGFENFNINDKNYSDYCIVGTIYTGSIFQWAQFLRGYEEFLIDLMTDKKLAESIMEKLLEFNLIYADIYLEKFGGLIDVVKLADDLATQDNLMIPMDMYKKYIKKRQKILIDFIKKRSEAKIFMHCCGAMYDLIPEYIDIGVDIINPIQTSANKMHDTKRLKKVFGGEITFWGGIDVQTVLSFGTTKEVKDEVKRVINDLAPGGGFVVNAVHNIQQNVPFENIIAMFESIKEFRKY